MRWLHPPLRICACTCIQRVWPFISMYEQGWCRCFILVILSTLLSLACLVLCLVLLVLSLVCADGNPMPLRSVRSLVTRHGSAPKNKDVFSNLCNVLEPMAGLHALAAPRYASVLPIVVAGDGQPVKTLLRACGHESCNIQRSGQRTRTRL
jgi:hypothetical protein